MNKNTLIIADGIETLNDVRQYITDVVIPDSITEINHKAFENCTLLTGITIPNSVTKIGKFAFYFCTSLTEINIPDSVTSIGNYAFEGCLSLESIYIDQEKDSLDLRYAKIPEICKVYWRGEF